MKKFVFDVTFRDGHHEVWIEAGKNARLASITLRKALEIAMKKPVLRIKLVSTNPHCIAV